MIKICRIYYTPFIIEFLAIVIHVLEMSGDPAVAHMASITGVPDDVWFMLEEFRIIDPTVAWKLENTSSNTTLTVTWKSHTSLDQKTSNRNRTSPPAKRSSGKKSPSQRARDSARLQKWKEGRFGIANHPLQPLCSLGSSLSWPNQDDRSCPLRRQWTHIKHHIWRPIGQGQLTRTSHKQQNEDQPMTTAHAPSTTLMETYTASTKTTALPTTTHKNTRHTRCARRRIKEEPSVPTPATSATAWIDLCKDFPQYDPPAYLPSIEDLYDKLRSQVNN